MRRIILSETARNQLEALLIQGLPKFGAALMAEMRDRVADTIRDRLAPYPATKKRNRKLGLFVLTLRRPPFAIVYDFDDDELRIYFIVHAHADLRRLDPTQVVW